MVGVVPVANAGVLHPECNKDDLFVFGNIFGHNIVCAGIAPVAKDIKRDVAGGDDQHLLWLVMDDRGS